MPRKISRHVPMESKVLGGFVQPGLALIAISSNKEKGENENEEKGKKNKKRKSHKKENSESDDELIPALAHLADDDDVAGSNNKNEDDLEYEYEERKFNFETKPMGFQIEAENGKIRVRSVRQLSVAGEYGVEIKW
eukprot:218366_1